jgi:hypothetical protein
LSPGLLFPLVAELLLSELELEPELVPEELLVPPELELELGDWLVLVFVSVVLVP